MPSVIAVFGPTASGKTAVAELIVDRLETEVVSADALQVYRGLPILTNQPDRPTRLVAIRGIDEEMSVGAYAALAHGAIDELVERTGSAVVCGGTGLYLRAALADLEVPPAPAAGVRDRILREVEHDPGGRPRSPQGARSESGCGNPSQRSEARRSRARARRGGRIARPGGRPSLDRRTPGTRH